MINLNLKGKTIPMDRFSSKKQRSTLMPRMFLYHRNSIILITIPYWLRNNHQTLPTHSGQF